MPSLPWCDISTFFKEREKLTYAERSPTIHMSIIGKCERETIPSSHLHKYRASWKAIARNCCGSTLAGIQATITRIIRIRIRLVVCYVFHTTIPSSISSQSAVIVDSPSKNMTILRQRQDMHAPGGNLNNTHIFGRKQGVETWTLNIDGGLRNTKTKLP